MKIDVKQVKIFVTVPSENVDQIRNAMSDAGAGEIGNYTCCSTAVDCTGTFLPNKDAKPYIGAKEQLEHVREVKLEMICDIENIKAVVGAIRENHPYEEPAIDIVPLLSESDF